MKGVRADTNVRTPGILVAFIPQWLRWETVTIDDQALPKTLQTVDHTGFQIFTAGAAVSADRFLAFFKHWWMPKQPPI